MFIDSGAADIEIAGHGIDVERLMGDHADDLPAGGVGYRLEYVSPHRKRNLLVAN
jgi:hypothetical protein